jgi:phage gp16-like protein
MIKQMKKTIGILLAVCFLMSVTAAAVSAVPSVVKEKKTAVLIFQHVKTKIFGHHHHKLTKAVKAMKTFVNS